MASLEMLNRIENTVKQSAGPTPTVPQPQPLVQQQAPQPTGVQNAMQTAGNIGKAVDNIPIVGGAKRKVTAGLGWVGEKLNIPSQKTEEFITSRMGSKNYEDAFNKVIPGAGILATPARFLLDPLNLLGIGLIQKPLKALKLAERATLLADAAAKIPKVEKAITFAKETPAIYKTIEKVNPYFRLPEAGKIIEETKTATQQRVSQLFRQVSEANQGLDRTKQLRIGQLLEGGVTTAKTDQNLIKIAEQFKTLGEQVGKEMVDAGLLKPEQYAKYKGQYMHHFWDFAVKGENPFTKISDIPLISGATQKFRSGAQGYVREFAPSTFKGLGTSMKDIEASKMYKGLAEKFAVNTPIGGEEMAKLAESGFKQAGDLSKARGGEVLNGKLLPSAVIDYIKRANPSSSSDLLKVYDKAMSAWKAGKTIYNPAYHVRNLVSNQMLSATQTGRNFPSEVMNYGKAVKDYAGKTKSQFFNEAVDAGLIKKVNFNEGVDALLNSGFKKENIAKKLFKKPAEFQQASEETAKLNVFTYFRKKGLPVKEAMNKAEEAIFSPYRLSQSERGLLGRIIPFYSFTRQSTPFIAKNLITHPERFTKYPKVEQAIQNLTEKTAPDEKNLPDYMKGMVRTPFKNKAGQPEYLNTQYLYPWGNMIDEGSGGAKLPFGMSMNPIVEEYAAQKTGIDPYFQSEFVKPGQSVADQNKARISHAATTFLPALYRSMLNKILPAAQGKKDYQGRERDLVKTVAGEASGFKLYPFDTKQGAKTSSYLRYQITDDYNAERKSVLKDKSLTTAEKTAKLKSLLDRKNERLQQLQK